MPGKHPIGHRLFAAHCPPLLTRKLEWVHANYQAKVPMTVSVASMVKLLLEEAVVKHIPADVLRKLEKEQEEQDGQSKATRRKTN